MILLLLVVVSILGITIGIIRKNRLISIISIVVLILLVTFTCFLMGVIPPDSRSYHHSSTESTDLSNENIEGLYLNDKINSEKIVSKYGEISTLSQDNDQYNYYYLTEGVEIATEKNDYKIIRFCVNNDKNLETEKGVSIGDNKEKVINLYGENYYTRLEQGLDIIGYVDKEKDWSIEFWLSEEGVCDIRFDYNYMV